MARVAAFDPLAVLIAVSVLLHATLALLFGAGVVALPEAYPVVAGHFSVRIAGIEHAPLHDAPPEIAPLEPIELPDVPKIITAPESTLPPLANEPLELPPDKPREPTKEAEPTPKPQPKAAPRQSSQASTGAETDVLPRGLNTNPDPPYPLDALAARRNGRVVLLVKVSAQGTALEASVATSSGHAGMDQSALTTVRNHWRFRPATRNGVAITYEVRVPIEFYIRQP